MVCFCIFFILYLLIVPAQGDAVPCPWPNDAFCASFRPIVSFFTFSQILLLLLPFYHLKLMQHNTTVTYTNHHPLPSLCAITHSMFFYFLFILLLLTNVLPRQVSETRPNNDPHQPPPTLFALRYGMFYFLFLFYYY